MTTKRRLQENSIKGCLIVILLLFLSLKSCVVKAETMMFHHHEHEYSSNFSLRADSAREKTDQPVYLGYELALGRPIYTLTSDLRELDHLRVGNVGVIVGGVAANKVGKLKVNAGMYYSDGSLPYTFDLSTAGVSANVYLLRIRDSKYHTAEPYFIGNISQQHVKFYGNYLNPDRARNYSTSEEQFLGRRITTQFNVGLGAEYQLEDDCGNFLHLFAEVTYGIPLETRCTREVFDRTHVINPFTVSVGVSFGKIIQRSK